jgi:phospholipase/lecithinase/hemolysin
MHFAVVAVGPLARRRAFTAADSVLYFGQIDRNDYARQAAHSVYVRDKSEIMVFGSSASAVQEKAQALRIELDESIEYISGVVYVEGLSGAKAR